MDIWISLVEIVGQLAFLIEVENVTRVFEDGAIVMHEEEIGDCMPGSSRDSMELLKMDHNLDNLCLIAFALPTILGKSNNLSISGIPSC